MVRHWEGDRALGCYRTHKRPFVRVNVGTRAHLTVWFAVGAPLAARV